jgi:acyl-CoA synthetase (AMP-forming)/AMP-acid ligase II
MPLWWRAVGTLGSAGIVVSRWCTIADVAGELRSRGPDLCAGYLDPDATAEAFTPDGWFRTGDIAILDDDGWLRIVDRRKDIIIRSGLNVSAREVEIVLLKHRAILEAAVVGAPDRSYERTGSRGSATS